MNNREVMQQALEALVQLDGLDTETECVTIDVGDVIAALKAALEQPEQEPLTEEEMANIWDDALTFTGPPFYIRFTRAIERAHNIKEQL